MMGDAKSQSILVSGESGAGKTETTKLIMQYLTYVGGRAASDDRTVEQQVFEGVLEAVRVSLAGYPTRRTYHKFVDRFGIIAMEFMDGSYNERAMTEKILQKLELENYQLGKTKIFLRAGQIGVLDSQRAGVLDSAAKRIQLRLRTFIAHKDFTLKRAAAISFQAYCRGHLARMIYAANHEAAAAILIQKCIRGWLLKNAYMQQYTSVLLLQASIRGFITRQRFLYTKGA